MEFFQQAKTYGANNRNDNLREPPGTKTNTDQNSACQYDAPLVGCASESSSDLCPTSREILPQHRAQRVKNARYARSTGGVERPCSALITCNTREGSSGKSCSSAAGILAMVRRRKVEESSLVCYWSFPSSFLYEGLRR